MTQPTLRTRRLTLVPLADLGLDRIFAQTIAVNTASRATMAAVGLSFAGAFISGGAGEDPIPGAEQGEVEYDITRARWLARRALDHGGTQSE